jgi:hypothetical protein
MSIEMLPFDTSRNSLADRARDAPAHKPPVGQRRLAANRRNAQRSTGPRTAAGKKRVSRNALKHGICAATVCLKSEDRPTFNLFLAEIERELQPRTVMQRILFDQIAGVIWRLRRLHEAQNELFARELDLAADEDGGETLSPAQVLARRFSDDRSNGFALLGRYESSLRNGLLRMLRQYESLKKHHPSTPYADDEDACIPREQAWSQDRAAAQRRSFDDRAAALQRHEPPRDQRQADIDKALWSMQRAKQDGGRDATPPATPAAGSAEQTHSKPSSTALFPRKAADSPPRAPIERRNKPTGQRPREQIIRPCGTLLKERAPWIEHRAGAVVSLSNRSNHDC